MTEPRHLVALGHLLSELRPPRSQQEVADQLGISRTTLSHGENGYILLSSKTMAGLLHIYQPNEGQRLAIIDALIACGAPHAV